MNIKKLKNIRENVSLKEYNTYRIGGRATYFIEIYTSEELIEAIHAAFTDTIPYVLLGGGTNTLVADEGFDGLVIKISHKNIDIRGEYMYADAGISMGALVQKAESLSLSGLEWAAGLPGTLGGAIYGNAGSYGKETKDIIESVMVFDIEEQKTKEYSNAECKFHYRHSVFKEKHYIILGALISLQKGTKEEIIQLMKKNLQSRIAHQPLGNRSEGCAFKNIEIISSGNAVQLVQKHSDFAQFKESKFLPAGFLIDKAGLKNFSIEKAKISEKHANFIVTEDKTKTKDVIQLIDYVKKNIYNLYGIELEEEIQFLRNKSNTK